MLRHPAKKRPVMRVRDELPMLEVAQNDARVPSQLRSEHDNRRLGWPRMPFQPLRHFCLWNEQALRKVICLALVRNIQPLSQIVEMRTLMAENQVRQLVQEREPERIDAVIPEGEADDRRTVRTNVSNAIHKRLGQVSNQRDRDPLIRDPFQCLRSELDRGGQRQQLGELRPDARAPKHA